MIAVSLSLCVHVCLSVYPPTHPQKPSGTLHQPKISTLVYKGCYAYDPPTTCDCDVGMRVECFCP